MDGSGTSSNSNSSPGCSTSPGSRNRQINESGDPTAEVGRLNLGQDNPIANPNYITRIFGNELIFGCIADHLGIPDLKILRQTSKFLRNQVNNHARFANNLQLTICGETVQELPLAESTIPWKTAKIIPGELRSATFPIIRNALRAVTDLHLDQPNAFRPKNLKASFAMLADLIYLKSLTLDMEYLYYGMPILALRRGVVKSLERLAIVGSLTTKKETFYKFMHNIGNIASLGLRLKVFEVGEGYKPLNGGYGLGLHRGPSPIQQILASSAATLTTLNISCSSEHLRSYEQLSFLNLRNIKLNFKCDVITATKFTAFLATHPNLESVHLTMENGNIPPAFLEAIQENCLQLHTLRLDGGAWLESFPNPQCWDFLDDLNHLREFKITGNPNVHDDNTTNCENMINPCLHSLQILNPVAMNNGGLRKIHMENLKSSRTNGWEALTINTLLGFPNLTELKLTDCKDLLNDNILQMICWNLTKIRVFHFGGSEGITDCGLTGEGNPGPNSGVSLKNLKGMQNLRIYDCVNVTLYGITESIQFQELKVADLRCGPNVCISDSILLGIANNNPSLEYVERYLKAFPSCTFDNIVTLNPRLTRVRSTYPPDFECPPQPENPASWRPSYGVMPCTYSGNYEKAKLRKIRSPNLNLANGYHLVLHSDRQSTYSPPSDSDSD